jgi:hypothetical protein
MARPPQVLTAQVGSATATGRAYDVTARTSDDEWLVETLLGLSDAALMGAL